MASPAVESTEARELALVDKVELRIALADSDSKLEGLLKVYLAPLLLKLGSEHLSVRNKLTGGRSLEYVNTSTRESSHSKSSSLFISFSCTNQPCRSIKLPIVPLLQQLQNPSQPSLVRHFDLVYIKQGLDRISAEERSDAFKIIVAGISSSAHHSTAHSSGVFNLLLRLLADFRIPARGSKEDDILRQTLSIQEEDAQYLSKWFGKLLLFRPRSPSSPGLSADEQAFLNLQDKPEAWDPSKPTGLNITNTKMLVLKLVGSGMFIDKERLFPALFAWADQNSRLSEPAEEILKRVVANVSLDDSSIVQELYDFYFGSVSAEQTGSDAVVPANLFLRIKILTLLSRTTESLKSAEKIVSIVERDLLENTAHALDDSKVDRAAEKLRAAIIKFLTYAVHNAEKEHIQVISEAIIPKLQQFIDGYVQDNMSLEAKGVRGRSFEVVGLLASANRNIMADTSLSFTKWLFGCLGQEADRDVLVSIDEAVSTILRPLQQTDPTRDQGPLQDLLLKNMSVQCRNRRNVVYATLRFANRCLPFSNVTGRLIDLIALGEQSNSHEILEEAKKGLDPYWHEMTSGENQPSVDGTDQTFPNLVELVKALDLGKTTANSGYRGASLGFCREVLLWRSLERASIKVDIAADWKRKLDLAVAEDTDARTAVRRFLSEAVDDTEGKETLDALWLCVLNSMQSDNVTERSSTARFAYELCALGPHRLLTSFLPTLNHLAKIVVVNDIEVRSLAAQAFGLLASLPEETSEPLDTILSNLTKTAENWRTAVGSGINQSHGATISLCYFSSRKVLRHSVELASQPEKFSPKIHLNLVLDMFEQSSDLSLQDAALVGLGQLCLSRAISAADINSKTAFGKLTELLTKKAQAGNEKAISALGNLSLLLDESEEKDELKQLLDRMHELHEIRQAETQFAVGEALSTALVGWQSKTLQSRYDIEGATPQGPDRTVTCPELVERVIQDCNTTKPSLKKAAVIWLLCFIQFAGERSEMTSRLQKLQVAFKRCLSDRDELVQESASRGLGLVYELGDRELKDDLVRDLIGSFSSNRANMSGTVTEDTQLFEPGALPTGDGSITTYKDIMSLAAEVGDSSLVYRFMSLASNNAIWSSRAAFGRFGLSNVLSDSSVDGYLAENPKLYPKLYRYRFDPNSNVRRSMNDIWNALVKDSNATIEANFDAIIEDLLSSIVSGRDWRARQASCAAMSDLVQGRSLERVDPYLDRIWTMCFKVIDDIKDSVRKAAAELARVLSALLIRTLENSQGASATAGQVLGKVLPFLLSTSGLESSADDVRALSLHTLLEIIKKAKAKNLRPFLAELIGKLLGLLSTFEPESINYISLNASKYKLKEQDIDDARLRGVRNSPLMEALERCLDQLDDETMAAAAEVLKEVMKTAVGLPTKVGVCRVVVSLCTRRALLVQPHSDGLLEAMRKRVVDRNDTVSSSYAATMGYLARGASDEQILTTVQLAQNLLFESEEERWQVVAGEMMLGMAKHAGDRFRQLDGETLPLVFVALHHDDERVREIFKETWEDNVARSRAPALFLLEISGMVEKQLGSRRWGVRHMAARAIAHASKAIAATQGSVSAQQASLIWPALRTALAEKSWEGKDEVLEGLVTLAERADDFWATGGGDSAEMLKIALREARRRNVEYQKHAIGALARVVAHWGALVEPDEGERLFEAVFDISSAAVDSSRATDAMDVDGGRGTGSGADSSQIRCVAAGIEALTGALAAGRASGVYGVLDKRFSRILEVLVRAVSENSAPVFLAVYDCCARSLQLLSKSSGAGKAVPAAGGGEGGEGGGGAGEQEQRQQAAPAPAAAPAEQNGQVEALTQLLFGQRDSILPEPVRQRRADAILSLSQTRMHATQRNELVRLVQSAQAQERSTAVRATLSKCL